MHMSLWGIILMMHMFVFMCSKRFCGPLGQLYGVYSLSQWTVQTRDTLSKKDTCSSPVLR